MSSLKVEEDPAGQAAATEQQPRNAAEADDADKPKDCLPSTDLVGHLTSELTAVMFKVKCSLEVPEVQFGTESSSTPLLRDASYLSKKKGSKNIRWWFPKSTWTT